jgi:hypothetical protein
MFLGTMPGNSERSSKYFAHQDCTSATKKSNVPQTFWVYNLRRKEYGKYRIWNTFKIYFSCILQVWISLPYFIDRKARTCGLVKAPCTRGVLNFFENKS